MDLVSVVITFALAAMIVALVFWLPFAIVRNLQTGEEFRDALRRALDELRLSRMLALLGVDRDRYLHHHSVLEIHKHMRRCDGCDEKAQCDAALEASESDPKALGFCANIDDLELESQRN